MQSLCNLIVLRLDPRPRRTRRTALGRVRVASIKKDTEEKNSFGRVRRGSAGLNKLAKQLDGGAAVCSGPRSGLRSLGRLVQ